MIENKIKLAILDMYNGIENQGMRCIREIAEDYCCDLEYDVFDIRQRVEIPDINKYDIYISSGGPGDPLEGDGVWDKAYFDLIDAIWLHNQSVKHIWEKKHVFFICHSFQMVCHHFGLGSVTKRAMTSFGTHPAHKTIHGLTDPLYINMPDPHYVVESRDYQLVQPNLEVFEQKGAKILALEKIRNHLDFERAILAVRFSPEFVGTQYHPEADPTGMRKHFEKPENRDKVIGNFGLSKYLTMMRHLDDKDKIILTHSSIIPGFLDSAIKAINVNKLEEIGV
jgi:homoserine O-succinyltransferase/O-acetyltransferase